MDVKEGSSNQSTARKGKQGMVNALLVAGRVVDLTSCRIAKQQTESSLTMVC